MSDDEGLAMTDELAAEVDTSPGTNAAKWIRKMSTVRRTVAADATAVASAGDCRGKVPKAWSDMALRQAPAGVDGLSGGWVSACSASPGQSVLNPHGGCADDDRAVLDVVSVSPVDEDGMVTIGCVDGPPVHIAGDWGLDVVTAAGAELMTALMLDEQFRLETHQRSRTTDDAQDSPYPCFSGENRSTPQDKTLDNGKLS